MANRLQIGVQFINQRLTIGDVQANDVMVGDAVEVLDHGANGVAVGADQDTFATAHGGAQGQLAAWLNAHPEQRAAAGTPSVMLDGSPVQIVRKAVGA